MMMMEMLIVMILIVSIFQVVMMDEGEEMMGEDEMTGEEIK